MSSPSFVDFLAEKVISFSSKMRDDTLLPYGGTFLRSGGNSYSTNHMDPLRAVSIFNKENGVLDFDSLNAYFLSGLLNEVYGMSDSNNSHIFHNFERPEYHFSRTKNGLISPHLLNLISNLNSYHLKNSLSPSNNILFGNLMNNLLNSYLDKQVLKAEFEMQNKSPVVVKNTAVTIKNNSAVIVKNISPMNEITMSLNINKSTETAYLPEEKCSELTVALNINKPIDITDLPEENKCSEIIMSLNISKPTEKTDLPDEKCNLSTNLKLNLKMARRKTKQISKRSKKRRRRQKKSRLLHSDNSALLSDDDSDSNCQASSHVSFIAKSPDFGCKISFQHNIHVPSSFVIPVESDSNDDSEWETYDEEGKCNSSSSTSDDEMGNCNSSSSISEDVDSDSSTSCSTSPVKSSIFSFVVPVEDSDDDSDWDCEPGSFDVACDFEFTGLFLPALCTPKTVPSSTDCNVSFSSEDETDEVSALRKILQEINKDWDNLAVGDKKSKPTSKVTFAPDEDLVEVFPVEMYERKGEWEIYATERLRFKRKIEELEKVISPCLHPEHRTKVFKTLMESNL